MENKSQTSYSWQTFSIFLSSTFADMHAERDHLKNVVFPKLDEELTKRRIKLNIVDLRWGVDASSIEDEGKTENENESNKEEQRERNILKVCLAEIDRCHPFFIGLLGDRYGWVPPEERMKQVTVGRSPLLPDKGKSVTALEIEFGVLVNPKQIKRSVFYFREPLDYSKFSPQKAALYCEEFDSKLSFEEKEERKNSLDKLKRIITEHFKKIGYPENVKTYSAEWDQENQKIVGLKEWGDKVYKDVLQECENQAKDTWDLLPKNWQEQELALLEKFIKGHTDIFCGRKFLLEELKSHLLSCNKHNWGLVLTGESGSGKSAVFSVICDSLKKENYFILSHSAGLSPRSRNIMDLLQIWNKQLSEFLGIEAIEEKSADEQDGIRKLQMDALSQTEENISGIEKEQDQFRELLFMAAKRKPIVLLIDALDRFEPTERAKYMTWLPATLPENIRMLCTAITGTEQKAEEFHTGLKVRSIDLFSKEDAKEMLLSICNQNHKALNEIVVQVILSKKRNDMLPASSSPLWLSLSLKLLLVLDQDDFEKINRIEGKKGGAVLEEYMKAMATDFPPLPGNLFLHLLLKASSLFGEVFTYAVFDNIACSRNGLREKDLERLFKEKIGLQWDALLFANLRRWFKDHLQEQGYDTQWNLNHSILRNTLLEKIGTDKARVIHQCIAHYLRQLSPVDMLRISETMYHLMKAGDAIEAVDYYSGKLFPEEVEANAKFLAEAITKDNEGMQWVLAMIEVAKNNKVFRLAPRFIFNLHHKLDVEGQLGSNLNLFEKLKEKLEEAQDITFTSDEETGYNYCSLLERIGDIYRKAGNSKKAFELFEEDLQFRKKLLEYYPDNLNAKNGLAISNEMLGIAYLYQFDLEKALVYFEAFYNVEKEIFDLDPKNFKYSHALLVSLQYLGVTQIMLGEQEKALNYFEESRRMAKEFNKLNSQDMDTKDDLASACNSLGNIYMMQAKPEKALAFFEESNNLLKGVYKTNPKNLEIKNKLAINYEKFAEALTALGNFEESQNLLEDSLQFRRMFYKSNPQNVKSKIDLIKSYKYAGDTYALLNNFKKGQHYYEESLQLEKELYESNSKDQEIKKGLAFSFSNLGIFCGRQGNWDDAISYLRQAIFLYSDDARFHINLSLALVERKDAAEAIQFAEQGLEKVLSPLQKKKEDSKDKKSTSVFAENDSEQKDSLLHTAWLALGLAFEAAGEIGKAIDAFKQSIEADPSKSAEVYLTLGNLYGKLEKWDEALDAYEQIVKIDPKNALVYSNIAYIFQKKGDQDKPLEYFEKAAEISPMDPIVWYDLGSAYKDKGEFSKAIGFFERSYSLDSNSYKTNMSLALAYEDVKNKEQSTEYYKRSLLLTDDENLKNAIKKQIETVNKAMNPLDS